MNELKANPLVTIVLPIYNVEKYLSQCMDSVVGQTYSNLEIICVNDGSTDDSRKILTKYAETDSRVKIIDQKNQGAGAARNLGIEKAKGEYITFWDGDDYFDLKMIELMVEKILEKDADICICDARQVDAESGKYIPSNYIPKAFEGMDEISWETHPEEVFISSVVTWNKLVRSEFLRENNILFPKLPVYQDFEYGMLCFRLAKKIVFLRKKLVYYRVERTGSNTYNPLKGAEGNIKARRLTYDNMAARGLLTDQKTVNGVMNKIGIDYRFFLRRLKNIKDYEGFYNRIFKEPSVLCEYDADKGTAPVVENFRTPDFKTYLFNEFRIFYEANEKVRQLSSDRYYTIKELERELRVKEQYIKRLESKAAKLESKTAKLESKIAKLEAIKASASYKIGRIITYIPRAIARIIKKRDSQ